MEEIVKHINDTNASYRALNAGDAKNTDLFLDNEHYELFKDAGDQITVRFNKENLQKAILFIASILPRKYDNSSTHKTIPFSSAFVLDQLAFLDAFFTVEGKKVETRSQVWNARKDVEKKNGEIDNRFYFNGLLEDVSYKSIGGEFKTAKFTIRNYVAGGYSDLHIKKAEDGIFDVLVTNVLEPYNDGKEKGYEQLDVSLQSLQQIFYGAPGTGKSHKIKDDVNVKAADEKNLVFRTTFHPDSDYSTFVGAYKPTMDKKAVRNVAGDIVKNTDKKEVYEDCIIYSFIPQAFLQSYVAAWNNNPNEKVFLIIEEINRGNCAQIFGDLFQLLDRDCNGFSEYPIMADKDLAKYLNGKDENGQDVLTNKDGIKDGKLRLPNNLYIWATMNTSDQSLFPIDSAFKRRWDWKYVPIDTRKEDWYIQIGDSYYSWTSFLEKVNNELLTDETAEDKHLGFYFCKANDGIISKETFVSKVLFYLWTDVFKIYGIPSAIGSSKDWLFTKFYNTDGLVNETMVKKLLEKLGIENEDTAKREESLIDTEKMENAAVNDKKNHPKEIRFEDGTSIDTTTKVFDAYIKAIEKIGIEKIATVVDKLKYRRKEHPLISKEKYPELDGKGGFSYHQIGDYYFVKGTKAYTYVRILEDLEKMLKVGMTVVCV